MQTAEQQQPEWLARAAIAVAVVFAGFILLRHDLAYWYDEVFTLGAAGINASGPDWPTLRGDVHPPTYILLVRGVSTLIDGAGPAIRLVNLLAVPVYAAAAMVLWRSLPRLAFWAAAILLGSNLFFFLTALELRSYGLLLSLSTLGHALWLARLKGRASTVALIATALCLSVLHFFGAAMAAALLLLAALRGPHRTLLLATACLPVLATLLWAFVIADIGGSLGGGLWITNGLQPWITFLSGLPLVILLLIFLPILRRRLPAAPSVPHPAWLLAPAAMVVAVALVISLHSPVISVKNLTVTIPGLVLFTVIALPPAALAAANATAATLGIAVAAAGLSAWKAGQDHEYVRWVTETVTPPECDGVPLFVFTPDIVDTYAQQVFLGQQLRPLRNLPDLTVEDISAYRGACNIIAAGWHEPGETDIMQRFFDARGIAVAITTHPQRKSRGDASLSPGFYIRTTP
ncbi:hypothetical protein [Algicella marina]|uniref:Glycosyltransferase RgtA/B/C/D-like domain-containing protein n=1 Tax=Algicella marina TaxID=2683284 RepID=A0A6P1T326_9RHOB|nr:hypothetical protein [Algicella marina]QHQ35866.1 hypothetical protein GO499_12120 [Algicella marina]